MDAKIKEKARKIFEAHPEYNILYVTEDGHFFTNRSLAMDYCMRDNGRARERILDMLEVRRQEVFTEASKTKEAGKKVKATDEKKEEKTSNKQSK